MSKKELIDSISAKTGETKSKVGNIVEAIFDHITDSLKAGDEVTLHGIGKLSATQRPARVGRNPRTGESATIPASVAPKFKASKTLKDALNPDTPARGAAA